MTVLEGIQRSTEFLAKKGLESPRLDSELLLAHVLSLKRMQVYLNFERILTETETTAYREFIRRRSMREPLQYIVGSMSFCGFTIIVNKKVLIPRSETELLAEAGWKYIRQLQQQPDGAALALDFGTGSGCIAIALTKNCLTLRMHAIDVSNDSLDEARTNAARHNVADRIEFYHSDGFAAVPPLKFDLIVSNPPYIATAEIPTLQPEVRDFDPHRALDGGADGLDFYRRLANEAQIFLKACGKMIFEFGDGQADLICKIFEEQKWVVESIMEDYTRRPRIMIVKKP